MSAQFQVGTWKQHVTTIASEELLLVSRKAGAGTRMVWIVLSDYRFIHLKPSYDA